MMELNLIICGSENIIFEFVIHGYRIRLKNKHFPRLHFVISSGFIIVKIFFSVIEYPFIYMIIYLI